MTLKGCISVMAILASICSTEAQDTADYIASVLDHLVGSEHSTPHCILYGIPALESTLEKALQDHRLQRIPKSIVTSENLKSFELPPNPSLVIIQASEMAPNTPNFLMTFKPSSRVIVLFSQASEGVKWMRLLTYTSFYNVAYLDVLNNRTEHRPSPDRLFKAGIKQNMRGRSITYTNRFPLAEANILVQWVKDTARFMNTTAREAKHNCRKTALHDPCYMDHLKKRNVDVDLTQHMSLKQINNHFGILFTNVPSERVLLVPRSQLNVVELLTLPFNFGVWIILGLLLISVEVTHLAVPQTFRNEPILLVVCGFERYDLHKAGRLEKFVLFSLILLLFFVSQAYETRLLSMMVSRPATRDINSIQDLLQSGVRIRTDTEAGSNFFQNDDLLTIVLSDTKDSIMSMDLVNAYVTDRPLANLVLPLYYDPSQRLYRYRIMDEPLGLVHVVFILRTRSPLLDVLRYTMTGFVESGIYDKLTVAGWTAIFSKKAAERFREQDNSLHFSDLLPGWMILLVGLATGIVAFVGEFVAWASVMLLAKVYH